MKTIAVTGGKGGTGKSTFSILLANKLRSEGAKTVLCDCDVECPNDHLLLGQKLNKPVQKVYAQFPKLIKEKCNKCGLCVRNCRSNAIFQPRTTKGSGQASYPIFLHELCSGCGLCWNLCPFGAIEVKKKVTSEIFENEIPNPTGLTDDESTRRVGQTWLITGRSVGIVEETGPIVSEVRKFATHFAREKSADYLLLDTAAGTHCSVIRALINTDLAYAVTEPTPLGAHDLKLILELLKKLKVPAKITLNQADLGNRRPIDHLAKDFGITIEFEIPYSRKIVEAYSRGKLSQLNLLSAD